MIALAADGTTSEIHRFEDAASGLEAVIVIDSTALGPAAGGCRFWTYDTPELMLADGVRLAAGMTYKNAVAGLPLGGGKAVLRRPVGPFDRGRLFEAFGRAVESLGGRYITAEDVGTGVDDMISVSRVTRHVAGLPAVRDRPGGDPSPWTALGVYRSMATAVEIGLGQTLSECRVAIQGLGHVGSALARMLHEAGAKLVVADIDPARVETIVAETGAHAVGVDDILGVESDILAPCALGGVLNPATISRLRSRVICGAANNQLATPDDGERLADAGILYAPDYVVNAGGIINVAAEHLGWAIERVSSLVDTMGSRLAKVLEISESRNLSPQRAADELARTIIARRGPSML